MELRQLRYFIAVADTLNFSRAAESMFISQSALSKQISDLEKELGVLLFHRNKHNVALTDAGLLLEEEAKAILLRLDKLPPLLQRATENTKNQTILIGVDIKSDNDPIVHQFLAEAVYQQCRVTPGLHTSFFPMETASLRQSILSGDLDLGIFVSPEPVLDKNLEHCLLLHDEMVLVLRSDEDLPSDLHTVRHLLDTTENLIITKRELPALSHVVRILNDIGCSPKIRFAENRTSMLLHVESGGGMVILPRSVFQRSNNPRLKALPLHTSCANLYFMAAWRQDVSPSVTQILSETRKSLQALQL